MKEKTPQEPPKLDNFIKLTLNNTLKDLMSALNAECGSLFLFDTQQQSLVLESFYNTNNLSIKGLKKRIGEGITGKVATSPSPVLVRNLDEDRRFSKNGFTHYKSNSFISIPVFSSKGLLGLINLADKTANVSFDEKDLRLAVTVVKYASLSIDMLLDYLEIKKQKEAMEKYASVGKLAAGIVHEINNPLDGIIRYNNILLKQLEENPIVREYLLAVKNGLGRIANITKSLLEFSRLVNSGVTQIKRYVDLHQVIDDSLYALSGRLSAAITVQKNYGTAIPKVMDFGLSHVITNILNNAIDAMPAGGYLSIRTEMDDMFIKVYCCDTGIGVPQEIKERIFEPFFTTKSIEKGTGLGLAICKEIVLKYGGDIAIDSSPGNGSTFTILIPASYSEHA
jgi:signal transduction histidine kinase